MNRYISHDLGIVCSPGSQYLVVILSCNKNPPIFYDVVKADQIDKTVQKLGAYREDAEFDDEIGGFNEIEYNFKLDEENFIKLLEESDVNFSHNYILCDMCGIQVIFLLKKKEETILDLIEF
jgi:hypothetical protein